MLSDWIGIKDRALSTFKSCFKKENIKGKNLLASYRHIEIYSVTELVWG